MSIMEDRERAFETKFAHDQEIQFKTLAQRNRLLADWVVRLIGLRDDEAHDYTRNLVDQTVERPDLQSLLTQLEADLEARGHDLPRRALQQKVDELTQLAREQVFAGT